MTSPFIVGISGGSGSGKTFLVNALMQSFKASDICFISQDNYYKSKEFVPKDANGIENFDTLEAIDRQKFLADVKKLVRGETVEIFEYTFNHPGKSAAKLILYPAPVVLIEGIFLFAIKELFDLVDFKIFVDAKDVVKIKRRILRDAQERGYDFNDVFYRYENHVSPAYEKYIYPFIDKADFVIPNHQKCDKAVEALVCFLKTKTEGRQNPG